MTIGTISGAGSAPSTLPAGAMANTTLASNGANGAAGIDSTGKVPQSVLDAVNGAGRGGAGKGGMPAPAMPAGGAAATSANGSAQGLPVGQSASDLQSTFLKLLVTEMKNQDPSNPMDSSQMTSQLAQINTVSGIAGLNTTMSSLATQLNATQQVSASSLIGKNVLADGNQIALAAGKASAFGMNLGAGASAVNVSILDSSGQTVRTLDMKAQQSGMTPLKWDGKDQAGKQVPDGAYTFKISAANGADPVTATALSQSKVDSVVQQPNGTAGLMLGNGSTTSLSSVAQIL